MTNNEDVLVSVIVPVYKVEKYLKRCIDSIRCQSHKNIEIIIVDDGSPDNCPVLCEDFAKEDKRVIVLHQENQGLGLARDRGIDIAKGEWICFVDSDDFVNPCFVERLLRIAIDNDCLTVQCRYKKVYSDETDEEAYPVEINLMDWRSYFIYVYRNACINTVGYTPFGAWANIYHCSLLQEIRFGNLRFAEDSGFTPRIIYAARKKPVAVTNEILYYYFQRPDSLLNSKVSLNILDRFYAKSRVMSFWAEKGEIEMYRLFFTDYFECMLSDYTKLCAELPEEYDKYDFLKDEIRNNLKQAKEFFNIQIALHPGAQEIWESISLKDKKFVVYGYGRWGKEFVYWLMYFGINIVEIWDQKSTGDDDIEGIPFKRVHGALDKDTYIIIAIEDLFLSLELQIILHKMGYKNFLFWRSLAEGLKYGKYKRFLPFIVENL